MQLQFVKLTGAGNDFVGIDGRNGLPGNPGLGPLARALCDRHFGIGADGIIVLAPSERADVRMLYYNADGSEGTMCGNGGRCTAVFARRCGIGGEDLTIEAVGHIYRARFTPHGVGLDMKDPVNIVRGIRLDADGTQHTVHAIDTGSPHIVQFVQDLGHVPVGELGKAMRDHARFSPGGTNVNFVEVLGSTSIAMRTYERGVEAETLACGTGSVASAIITHLEYGFPPPIRVRTWSGQWLRVGFTAGTARITDVTLEGPADMLFAGATEYDPDQRTIRSTSIEGV